MTTNVLFLGDTSFGENYQDNLISKGRNSIPRPRGYAYMLEGFQGNCAASDFTVANLETPVTDRFPSPDVGSKKYRHYADVENVPRYVDALRVHLVTPANNHTLGLIRRLHEPSFSPTSGASRSRAY